MVKSQRVKQMDRHYFLIVVFVALGCLFLIFYSLWKEIEAPLTKEAPIEPPLAPFNKYISGVGIVEPSSGNIFIGVPVNRIVEKVAVVAGAKVKKGQLLFELENRDLKAAQQEQEYAYQSAIAKYDRLKRFPRPEDFSTAKGELDSAKIAMEEAQKQYEMVQKLIDPRSISGEEKTRRHANFLQAESKFHQARANFEKVKKGTWGPDLEVAKIEVDQAKANLDRTKADLERTIIQSPIDGTILQIKIHDGEAPPLDSNVNPTMIIGNIDELYLRVSINQLDIPYFNKNSPAVAYLQGDSKRQFTLEFVHVEPYLVTKQNLTNEITEKVDTRVLQILYRIKEPDQRLFVGEQMDAFIQANYP